MNRNLLIVGASTYAVVASEIAVDMGCFERIDFVDDERKITPTGIEVVGTTQNIDELAAEYSNIVVAIGNPKVRLALLNRIKQETSYRIVSLISPKAYISPTAQIGEGCIIEPMVVVHTGCIIAIGCIISAGAVINHVSMCCDGVHVDCNATVEGYCLVPAGTKICCGEVYKRKETVNVRELFFDSQRWTEQLQDISKRKPQEIDGLEYTFESGI